MLDLVWISYPGLHIDHDLQLYLFFDSFFIAWFWMCIWILCRCWEWACGNCETERIAWRVIEVIAIYFGIYFEMEAGNKSRVLRIAIFEKCLCMPSLGMMACEFSCRNMVDIWILPRLKYPALRVPPAETRLTVYRRLWTWEREWGNKV